MGDNTKSFSQLHQPGQEVPDEGEKFGWDSQTQLLKSEFCRTALPTDRDGHRQNQKSLQKMHEQHLFGTPVLAGDGEEFNQH